MRLWSLVVLIAGCAAAPEGDAPSGKALKDPKRLLPTFKAFILRGDYAKAHECLSKGAKSAVPYEAFFAVMTAYDATSRLIAGLEEHGLDTEKGTIRICNAEFGISRDFKIVKEFKILWKFDFAREEMQYFQDQALAWFRKQVETAGRRHFVYPPDWHYAKVIPHCGCKRDE